MASAIGSLWRDFWDWIEKFEPEHHLFRGEPSKNLLLPRIGRPEYSYTKPREKILFDQFKRLARSYVSSGIASDWEWLALAQHHGAPTRLLDWSSSPLVAAWFATSSFPLNETCFIYALDVANPDVECFDIATGRGIKNNQRYDSPLEVHNGVFVIETPPVSQRITTQRGLFTLHGNPEHSLNVGKAWTFAIPGDRREAFQKKLLSVGIDYSHVFPDLDGLCKSLDWKHRLNIGLSPIT